MTSKIDLTSMTSQTEEYADFININHAAKIAISLGTSVPPDGGDLPHLWHWAFFVKPQPGENIGPDGHPDRHCFPLPVAGYSRMWAGGRVNFIQPLRLGLPALRRSKVIKAVEKQGSSGQLFFLTVQHQYLQADVLCISEEQDIVYRQPAPPILSGTKPVPPADWQASIAVDSVRLFRYSAVTYNAHRIHYDAPYAREVEGYPGLVVHGPMIATLMLQAFVNANPDASITSLAYRGLRPLIAPGEFVVAGALAQGQQANLWAAQDGTLAHQALLTYA